MPCFVCHGCGAALAGHASSGRRRMAHPMPACSQWLDASGRRTSFRAEIYEWQIGSPPGVHSGMPTTLPLLAPS